MSTQEQNKIYEEKLTPLQYRVTREGATERPFTGLYWNAKDDGTYDCICCGTALFESTDKYDSGSGWPSFTRPVEGANITEIRDDLMEMNFNDPDFRQSLLIRLHVLNYLQDHNMINSNLEWIR